MYSRDETDPDPIARGPVRLPSSWFALVPLLVAGPLAAQTPAKPDWRFRFDRPAPDSALPLETMSPGWHATTKGVAGIYYQPGWTAGDNYRLESTIFVFPSSAEEGYGIFFGGTGLEGADQSYFYFLLRRDGRFLIRHRQGDAVHPITDWTPHSAIAKPTEDKTGKNVLAVDVAADTVRFLVNGERVAGYPRSVMRVADGFYGLRLNHGLNVHVTAVTKTP